MNKKTCILLLSHDEAERFFLKSESYFNASLPSYIKFNTLLDNINKAIDPKNLEKIYESKTLNKYENVNHIIYSNKDGKHAWRPLQLINPAIYVRLVKEITLKENWEEIKKRFNEFKCSDKIECLSIPKQSNNNQSDKATQIKQWWEDIEQKSIALALDYEKLIHIDIANCYGSIYTHSIAWALHNKAEAKAKRRDEKLIGNIIDNLIREMSYGQTNGIPQGSVLMDFIAEMVLGYIDSELADKIGKAGIEDFKILRYRDDYRIFFNNPKDGEEIVRNLIERLKELGLQLNSYKTLSTESVVRDSIKPDKLSRIRIEKLSGDIQKQLLVIHSFSEQFPNSGSLEKMLNNYAEKIKKRKEKQKKIRNLDSLISIIVDIAYHNPRTYASSASILSTLLSLLETDEKEKMITRITNKFNRQSNTGFMELWLQRITIKLDRKREYTEPFCKYITGDKSISLLWGELEWLNDDFKKIINDSSIIDEEEIRKLPDIIDTKEFSLFSY